MRARHEDGGVDPRRIRLATAQLTRLAGRARLQPTLAIVLGSGFQAVADRLELVRAVPYERLPGFPAAGVAGHAGRLLLGRLQGVPVCLLSGRAHYYEGHSMAELGFPIRVLAQWGVRDLLLTNAAGAIRRGWHPGEFMALTDHINMMGANPLRGPAWPGRERFVDLTCVYDVGLRRLLGRAARLAHVRLRAGVYLAVSGPSYETPAEIRAFAGLGADAVGMSTVPEAIVARQCGLAVGAVSCLANAAAGKSNGFLSHADVLEAGRRVAAEASSLLEHFVRLYAARG